MPVSSISNVLSGSTLEIARDVVSAIRFFHDKGWCPATSSNFSFREPGVNDQFYVSMSGLDKGTFEETNFLAVDMAGQIIDPDLRKKTKPSAETLLHSLIYKHDPEANVILHMHSVNTTVLSKWLSEKNVVTFSDYEILKGFAGITTHDVSVDIPIYPNSQDMAFLAKRIGYDWQQQPLKYGFILRGHGVYAWGKTVAEAKRHVEVFEYLFDCTLKLHHLSK